MSDSYTVSEPTTFTVTHARHMAAKVATDLKRMQRLYGQPSDADITSYETEVIELLKAGYLGTVTYGFRRDGSWVPPTLCYTAKDLSGGATNDDDPGKVPANANVVRASFYSYLTYSSAWDRLTTAQTDAFKKTLPSSAAARPNLASMATSSKIALIPPAAKRWLAQALGVTDGQQTFA